MKKKHLNKLKIASLTLMLGCFTVGGVYNHYKEEQQENVVKVERNNLQAPKQYANYNNDDYVITLSTDELNNYTWYNLGQILTTDPNDRPITSISYDGTIYNSSTVLSDGAIEFYDGNNYLFFIYNSIQFNEANETDYNNNVFADLENVDFIDDAVLNIETGHYSTIKSAIELDIQANQPVSMGESIVSAITSGLGLIGDLASEFLTGFSTLFWDATANSGNGALTNFGTFSLVFLGIAITMAIIKLCLNILRGSTGA